jgi:protein-disulfide isomerase/uncharacterized membrane protein
MTKKYWWWSCGFVFAGLLTSCYAFYHYLQLQSFGGTEALCNINSFVSCDKVARSVYSSFLGIPLGVWGIGYFLASLSLLCCSRKKSFTKYCMQWYSIWGAVGILVVVALAIISLVFLKNLCLICLFVYAAVAGQFTFIYLSFQKIFSDFSWKGFGKLSFVPFAALALVFGVYFNVGWNNKSIVKSKKEVAKVSQVFDIPVSFSAFAKKGQDYFLGSKESTVQIVAFADFECPACKDASAALLQVKKEFKNKVLVVFKNYPLDNSCNNYIKGVFHKNSCNFAKLARCAGRYEMFWKYHDLAFASQNTKKTPVELAKKIGLSKEDIDICLQDDLILQKIKDDIELANSLGIKGTPTIYINGRLYEGSRSLIRHEVAKLLNI